MDWSGAIIDGISESHLLVLVFSSNANDSPQIKRELERAVNKGLPIIPFRIENVPLSKPLEYFISTPHWLDALTPPMEKHLNYLGETVEVLLKRKTAEQMILPLPSPKPKDTPALLWAAMILAVVVIAGGALLISRVLSGSREQPIIIEGPDQSNKFAKPEQHQKYESEDSQPIPAEKVPFTMTEDPGQQIQSKDSVDPSLVGNWSTNPIVDGKPWNLKLRIQRNATFDFSGTLQDGGSYLAQAGRWQSRTTKGESDSGTYTFQNANMVTIL